MLVQHVSISDIKGGAARAAYRIHGSLRDCKVESRMLVLYKKSQSNSVQSLNPLPLKVRFQRFIHRGILKYRLRHWHTENPILHSFGITDLGLKEVLNESEAEIIHLHWINDMISVENIGELRKPIVWTLHDMWPYCGAEHYTSDHPNARFIEGYLSDNRPFSEQGPDMNRMVWERKKAAWSNMNMVLVAPSRWMAQCIQRSKLFQKYPVHIIPYPLDMENTWHPVNQSKARRKLGLPPDKKIILAGAQGGVDSWYKGGDLLVDALIKLSRHSSVPPFEVAVFGELNLLKDPIEWPCAVHYLGQIDSDELLSQAYSAADVMVVPSRQDNLPQTGIEAQACGTPVVAFAVGGLIDIVEHKKTGWLAPPFDTDQLAEGLLWLLSDKKLRDAVGLIARERAGQLYSPEVVAGQYLRLYKTFLR